MKECDFLCPVDGCQALAKGLGELTEVEQEIVRLVLKPAPGATLPCYDVRSVAERLQELQPKLQHVAYITADDICRYIRAIEQAEQPDRRKHEILAAAYGKEAARILHRFLK